MKKYLSIIFVFSLVCCLLTGCGKPSDNGGTSVTKPSGTASDPVDVDFSKADADMFTPSCPHLHSTDGKYKLNVYTGELYDIRLKKTIRNKVVNNDELNKLWSETKFLQFAMKMRQLYFEKYPQSQLPQIPVFA